MEKNEIFTKNNIYIFLSIVGFLIIFKMAIYTVRETRNYCSDRKKEIEKFENLKKIKLQIPISFYFEKKNYLIDKINFFFDTSEIY